MDYKLKYLKYKKKYLNLKKGGGNKNKVERDQGEKKQADECKIGKLDKINCPDKNFPCKDEDGSCFNKKGQTLSQILKKENILIDKTKNKLESNLPEHIRHNQIFEMSNCKDIIKYLETHRDQLEHYSNEMWCHLIDNIDIKYYPYNYSKMKTPPENPQHPYKKLMDQKVICNNNIYCRLFATKCMHKYLVTKYQNENMQRNWFSAIVKNNVDDYKKFYHFDINLTDIDHTQLGPWRVLTKLTIPDSVTIIKPNSFRFAGIRELVIPDSVTTIGNNAFRSNQLRKLVLPNSVTSIGDDAFLNNDLRELDIPNSVTTIGDGAFLGNQLTELVIPDSVIFIGNSAFQSNKLRELTISNFS